MDESEAGSQKQADAITQRVQEHPNGAKGNPKPLTRKVWVRHRNAPSRYAFQTGYRVKEVKRFVPAFTRNHKGAIAWISGLNLSKMSLALFASFASPLSWSSGGLRLAELTNAESHRLPLGNGY